MCMINKKDCKNEAEEVKTVCLKDDATGVLKFLLYSCEECGEQYLIPQCFSWEL